MLIRLFKTKNTCEHKSVPDTEEEAYCQDCGAYVKNEWYLVRCACCGVKRKSVLKSNDIHPQTRYCKNCGHEEFIIEKIESLNFLNVAYSVLIKRAYKREFNPLEQVWVDDTTSSEVKLLTQKH